MSHRFAVVVSLGLILVTTAANVPSETDSSTQNISEADLIEAIQRARSAIYHVVAGRDIAGSHGLVFGKPLRTRGIELSPKQLGRLKNVFLLRTPEDFKEGASLSRAAFELDSGDVSLWIVTRKSHTEFEVGFAGHPPLLLRFPDAHSRIATIIRGCFVDADLVQEELGLVSPYTMKSLTGAGAELHCVLAGDEGNSLSFLWQRQHYIPVGDRLTIHPYDEAETIVPVGSHRERALVAVLRSISDQNLSNEQQASLSAGELMSLPQEQKWAFRAGEVAAEVENRTRLLAR